MKRMVSAPLRAHAGEVSHDGRPMKYAHGQHAAYVLDRCHCAPCKSSNTAYEKARAGRIVPPFVLANEARQHVQWLATQGVGRKQIAKVSGVAHGTLCKLIYGDPRRGSAPSKRIRWETHEAILAVTPADCGGNCKVIPAGPTWVLLDEMITAGVPKSTIAAALGRRAGLQIKRTTVSAENRDAVKALHARWRSGDWTPVRRDRHGNRRTIQPAPIHVNPALRVAAYEDRTALIETLAEVVEARNERTWRNESACRGRPPSLWFPQRDDTATMRAALKICRSCLCRRECLMANLHEREGIYGGTTARERQRLRAELVEAA